MKDKIVNIVNTNTRVYGLSESGFLYEFVRANTTLADDDNEKWPGPCWAPVCDSPFAE